MKLAAKITFLIGVCCSLMLYSGCSKKHPAAPSVSDMQLDILTKGTTTGLQWKVSAVTKDGVDQKPDYLTFVITLKGALGQQVVNYSTSGRTATKYPWATSGTLTFDAISPATTLIRDDSGLVVTYAATTSQLTMSFTYSGPGFNTRQQVVTGAWLFTFVPN